MRSKVAQCRRPILNRLIIFGFLAHAGIVNCYREKFPTATLFVSEESHNVIYDHRSVLQADLACMHQLIRENDSWQVRSRTHGVLCENMSNLPALHELGGLGVAPRVAHRAEEKAQGGRGERRGLRVHAESKSAEEGAGGH